MSFIAFIMPAGFYLLAEKKFGSPVDRHERRYERFFAWVIVVFGFCVFVVLMAANIMSYVST